MIVSAVAFSARFCEAESESRSLLLYCEDERDDRVLHEVQVLHSITAALPPPKALV